MTAEQLRQFLACPFGKHTPPLRLAVYDLILQKSVNFSWVHPAFKPGASEDALGFLPRPPILAGVSRRSKIMLFQPPIGIQSTTATRPPFSLQASAASTRHSRTAWITVRTGKSTHSRAYSYSSWHPLFTRFKINQCTLNRFAGTLKTLNRHAKDFYSFTAL